MENAKVFAENVIRNRKEAINLRRFGVKMGALASKLESAYRTQEISNTIAQSVPLLQNCMKKMDAIGVSFHRVTIFLRWPEALVTSKNCSKTWTWRPKRWMEPLTTFTPPRLITTKLWICWTRWGTSNKWKWVGQSQTLIKTLLDNQTLLKPTTSTLCKLNWTILRTFEDI